MPKGGYRGEKHGHASKVNGVTREYRIWEGMRQRCTNPKATAYDRYGGRGITVCGRWNDFAAFLEDMGHCPSDRHSLDRIDNDGPYAPDNCRWVLHKQQCRNTARNRWVTVGGERLLISEAIKRSPVSPQTAYRRINSGWNIERALTTPPDARAGKRAKRA